MIRVTRVIKVIRVIRVIRKMRVIRRNEKNKKDLALIDSVPPRLSIAYGLIAPTCNWIFALIIQKYTPHMNRALQRT